MSEIEEVQEQMKADMEATKDQMTTMMEAMISMRKMMEVNVAAVATTSVATEVDPTHPSGVNQVSHPVLDMVSQGGEALGSTGGPHFAQVQSKHPFTLYGLPPNYAPPNVVHVSMRTLTTLLLYPLRDNNLSLRMHMSLNPWGRHMKYPDTTLGLTSTLTSDMPLRFRHLVAYPSRTPWEALSIVHNRNYNPYIFRWEDYLLPCWKGKNLIT